MFATLSGGSGLLFFALLIPFVFHRDSEKPVSVLGIKIAHFNVLKHNQWKSELVHRAEILDADFLSFQEVNTSWADALVGGLKEKYPYFRVIPGDSHFGLAVFSKYPMQDVQDLYFQNFPNIAGLVNHPTGNFRFLASHTVPPVFYSGYKKRNRHLEEITTFVEQFDEPFITIGDYNIVPWAPEITELKSRTGLIDSRKGICATFPSWSGLARIPIDFIFHSPDFICEEFSSVSGTHSDHLGVTGVYSFRSVSRFSELK